MTVTRMKHPVAFRPVRLPSTLTAIGALVIAMLGAPLGAVPVSAEDAAERAAREIADARDRANRAADEYFAAVSRIESLELEAESLSAEVAALEATIGALSDRVQQIAIRRFTRSGSATSPLLNGFSSPEEQMQLAALSAVIDDTSDEDFDEYDSVSRDLLAATRRLEENRDEATRERDNAATLRDRALAQVAELERIEAQRLQDEKVRKALEAERRARAEREAARQGSGGSSGGSSGGRDYGGASWVCPTGDAPVGFSDTWGAPRSGGRTHQGVDLIGARGTPILAVVSGSARGVTYSLGGISAWLAGDDGNSYFYAHLDGYGQLGRVSAGTVIGYMGDTGNAQYSTVHLHFEIHPGGGAAVNPYPTVRAHC